MQDFHGNVAVITGAASGVGWGLAEYCAKEGMKVVLADVEGPALEDAGEELRKRGADVLTVLTDVAKLGDVENLAQKTLDTFGGVHLLFNNAGVQVGASADKPLWENTLEDWHWVMGVNLWGVIYGTKVFIPIMLQQQTECHVVNTSSMAGLITEPMIVIYAATKAGVIKLSEGLYLQLKQKNSQVGVSVLCPAFVHSRLNDAERNRPGVLHHQPATTQETEHPSWMRAILKGNWNHLSPEQCAKMVFTAIRKNKFYILTDPLIKTLIHQRVDHMLQGLNPEIPRFE